jgi:hypothetical protein
MPQVAEPKRHLKPSINCSTCEKGKLKERMMSTRRIPMMTEDEIQAELGWIRSMIYSLLQAPDSDTACRLYRRDRVLAVAHSPEGQAAQRRWDATLRSSTPNTGWTPRLGDIGREFRITAVGAGRMLELLGYRSNKCVTDSAMAAGFGVPRWNGFTMQDDWHLARVVAAIKSAAQDPEKPAIADALAAAVANQQGRERVAARKRKQGEEEAARRLEEEAVLSGLRHELQTLQATAPGMSLLDAVEFVTSDPGQRIALYRFCSPEDRNIRFNGMGQDDSCPLKIVGNDVAFLKRRAMAEGFQV